MSLQGGLGNLLDPKFYMGLWADQEFFHIILFVEEFLEKKNLNNIINNL